MAVHSVARQASSLRENEAEARRIFDSLSADELAPLAGFGFTIENSWSFSDRKEKVFAALSDWHAQHVEPFRKDAVMVDTTTLATVEAFARGGYEIGGHSYELSVTPGLLYDLCTFINAVVLFDTVFHLESSLIDSGNLNASLASKDPPLRRLPVQSFDGAAIEEDPIVGVGGALTSLMWNAQAEVSSWRWGHTPGAREARDAVGAAWGCATNSDVKVDQFANGECLDHDFYSDGPQLLHQALKFEHVAPDEKMKLFLDPTYLTESTVRSIFNTGLSEAIGVGYAASSARLPFRRYWLDIQDAARAQLLVSKQLDVALRGAATRTVDKVSLELPFFAAAVIRNIRDPKDLLPTIGRLRNEAAGFRARRAELNAAIDEGNDPVIAELSRAVQDESKSLMKMLAVPVIGATIAVVTAPVALAHSLWVPMLVVYAFSKDLVPEDRERLHRRLARRHLCFLTKTADQSRQLLDAYPAIDKLWPLSPVFKRDDFGDLFASLGQLGES